MVVFVVVSVLVGSALAGGGGWRALAKRYPAPGAMRPDEERHRFCSITVAGGLIGAASYRSCVTVGVGAAGLSLALWAPFKLFHPPLFIPWDAVARCRAVERIRGRWTQVTTRNGIDVTFAGRVADDVYDQAVARGLVEGAPAGEPWRLESGA